MPDPKTSSVDIFGKYLGRIETAAKYFDTVVIQTLKASASQESNILSLNHYCPGKVI
jgi:hypothetical protein